MCDKISNFKNKRFAMNKCINWNGLPCILTDVLGEEKAVVFTNINGDLVACEMDSCDINNPSMYDEMKENRGFDCLYKTMPIQDEFTLVLSLTERCNAGCKYCFLDAQTTGNVMEDDIMYKALQFVFDRYPDRLINIAAFGGEPSTEPEKVYKMVDYSKKARKGKMAFSITTNGYFDDDFCEFLIKNEFRVSLSMDGIPDVQEVQRPSAVSVKQLEKNIKKIAASGCEFKVRCTVTEYSVKYMLDTVKYLGNLGVKRIHFEPVTPGGRAAVGTEYTRQPKEEVFVKSLFECIDYGSENDIDVICFPYMNMLMAPMVFCDGNINNRLVVGATGVLSTCVEVQNKQHMLFPALGVGYFDAEKGEIVLEYEHRRPMCRGCSDLVKNEDCLNCAFKFFCAGGCPTRNYRGSDSTEIISNYRCNIMKMVMPSILEKYYISTYGL